MSAGEGDSIKPSASFGIGIVSGIVYIAWSVALKHFRFDDAVDTVAGQLLIPAASNSLFRPMFSRIFNLNLLCSNWPFYKSP